MAREVLTLKTTLRTGLNPGSYTAATVDGHAFDNTRQDVILHVKNGSGSPTTVTIDTPDVIDGLAIPQLDVTIPASEERFIGPFPKELYNQVNATLGLQDAVHINAAPQTSVTYAAIKLGSLAF